MGDVDLRVVALEARVAKIEKEMGLGSASDQELDGPYGNPTVRKDPPKWSGPSFAGKRFSECSPEFLESLAGFYDWKAGKDAASGAVDAKGRPKATYSRKDAARARGWAERIRNGWKGQARPFGGPTARPQPRQQAYQAPQERATNDDPFGFPPEEDDFGF